MIFTKKITRYGDAFVIRLAQQDRDILELNEEDIVEVDIKKVIKDELLPKKEE